MRTTIHAASVFASHRFTFSSKSDPATTESLLDWLPFLTPNYQSFNRSSFTCINILTFGDSLGPSFFRSLIQYLISDFVQHQKFYFLPPYTASGLFFLQTHGVQIIDWVGYSWAAQKAFGRYQDL